MDTLNLDGETNLKEKIAPKETNFKNEKEISSLRGDLVCDSPNEFLDRWDGNITLVLEDRK